MVHGVPIVSWEWVEFLRGRYKAAAGTVHYFTMADHFDRFRLQRAGGTQMRELFKGCVLHFLNQEYSSIKKQDLIELCVETGASVCPSNRSRRQMGNVAVVNVVSRDDNSMSKRIETHGREPKSSKNFIEDVFVEFKWITDSIFNGYVLPYDKYLCYQKIEEA